jgi:hypothetical protein
MKPLTQKQIKAAWIVALILVLVHFAPGFIHAATEAFSARFHSASTVPVKPSASRTFTPLPPNIASLATPPPPSALLPRFYGNWEGSQFRPTLDQCKIHLQILPSVESPGQVSAYETRVCFDSAYIVGGSKLPQGGLQQLMVNASPISTVMTGQPNQSGSQIDFHVDKIVGSTPSQCPLVSYSTSIFGDQSIVAQWKAGTCANGDGQIVLARTR